MRKKLTRCIKNNTSSRGTLTSVNALGQVRADTVAN